MTHQAYPNVISGVVQTLSDHGFDGMAQAMELLINECIKIERQQALGVGAYQQTVSKSVRRQRLQALSQLGPCNGGRRG
jgi:hypothetical protein